jgi:hypothetical protein
LYVCYDPKSLVELERVLLRRGYDVVTVLGTDGLISHVHIGDSSAVLFGAGGSVDELAQAAHWLGERFPAIPVVSLKQLIEDHLSM